MTNLYPLKWPSSAQSCSSTWPIHGAGPARPDAPGYSANAQKVSQGLRASPGPIAVAERIEDAATGTTFCQRGRPSGIVVSTKNQAKRSGLHGSRSSQIGFVLPTSLAWGFSSNIRFRNLLFGITCFVEWYYLWLYQFQEHIYRQVIGLYTATCIHTYTFGCIHSSVCT